MSIVGVYPGLSPTAGFAVYSAHRTSGLSGVSSGDGENAMLPMHFGGSGYTDFDTAECILFYPYRPSLLVKGSPGGVLDSSLYVPQDRWPVVLSHAQLSYEASDESTFLTYSSWIDPAYSLSYRVCR